MVHDQMKWEDFETKASGNFEPRPFCDGTDDSITLFFSADESYRERVDPFLTVYRSFATRDVVGCHLKDVKKILARVKALNIGIEAGSITLGILLLSVPWAADESVKVEQRHYREVVEPVLKAAGSMRIDEFQTV